MRYLSFRTILIFLIALFTEALPAETPSVRIGVVVDGLSPRTEEYLEVLKREVGILLEDEYAVELPEDKIYFGDWTLQKISDLSDRLLTDPDVDVVVALGFICSQYIAGRPSFDKPTFLSSVIDPVLQQLPFEERTIDTHRPGESETFRVSGIRNLNYLVYRGGTNDSFQRFREIVPFSKAAILVMQALTEAIPSIDDLVAQSALKLGVETVIVPVPESVPQILAGIPEDSEMAFITPLFNLTADQMDELIRGLNERKLPTLSVRGREEVERGMMVSLYSQDDPVTRSRRIGLNIQEALDDHDPGEMSIEFDRASGMVINMDTVRLVGVSPKYTTLLEAELLNEEPRRFQRTLSLGSVVREAHAANLDLSAADRAVAAAEAAVGEARGALLPQIGLSGQAGLIDSDRARNLPTLSEKEFSGSISGSQLVYSDRTWADYSIQKSLRDLSAEQRSELRLDVVLEAAANYLNLLRAQTVESIQKENLNLTRNNLRLASSRVEIGAANRVELFRWESQIAANQRDVVDSGALKNQARIAVNRVLNRPLDEVFGTVEASLNDPELVASFDALTPYIDNPKGFALYSKFMSSEASEASPEIKRPDASIRASEREYSAAKRSFFLPDIGIQGGITAFDRRGVGSEPIPGINDTDWFAAVTGTIPIFQGAGRIARLDRTKRQVEELEYQRESVKQRVEQSIRSSLEAANASFLGIELSRAQSRAAAQNYDLVKDSYAAGMVGILDLLDAQNQFLVAQLGEANAVYAYLNDLMLVQRATGRFDFFRSPGERNDFLLRLDQFFKQEGIIVRR